VAPGPTYSSSSAGGCCMDWPARTRISRLPENSTISPSRSSTNACISSSVALSRIESSIWTSSCSSPIATTVSVTISPPVRLSLSRMLSSESPNTTRSRCTSAAAALSAGATPTLPTRPDSEGAVTLSVHVTPANTSRVTANRACWRRRLITDETSSSKEGTATTWVTNRTRTGTHRARAR
jgi:hypothetical protein